ASFAEKRGKIPLAEVIGYGASMDAFHAVMPKPDGSGAKKAMEAALKDADLSPDSIEYINAHGTGTYHNDGMEARAILSLFGERGKTIPTSSIKPFIGHLLSAAGAVETVASLLPFVHGIIPPTLHFKTPDPECPIYCVPNNSISANPDIIMKNSYGLGGQNTSLILGKIGIS
ncbi:beta-ketoacyl-[acyl-carrier-protein] synthase II, partial [bacterium]|nr:beta-ketoacyl-[acyl-carrier-protein] synthase II [bacterium]